MTLINQRIWSPNWSTRPHGKADVKGVILHHTATRGSRAAAIAVARYFAQRSSRVSATFVVADDGYAIQCVPFYRAAWHAGPARYDWDHDGKIEPWNGETSINTTSIGIEICNRGDGKDNFPDAQVKKVARLIRYADGRCPNLRFKDITDHEAVLPGQKIDMQPNFPAAKMFWWLLHGANSKPPNNVYSKLPRWAQKQCNEIRR